MDSMTRWASSTTERGVEPLRRVVPAMTLLLVVYLPLEAALLGLLPPAVYWVFRLLPDALIALMAIAVVLIGDPRARTRPVRILWVVGLVTILIVVASVARGLLLPDAINAVRVLVRYLVLGLLLWWAVDGRERVDDLVIRGLLVVGAIEIGVVLIQIASRALDAPAGGIGASTFFMLDGTFGRYDRLGLFLMGVILALVATSKRIQGWRLLFIVACTILLYLSTSRQAMVGLSIACLVIAAAPALAAPRRAFAVAMSGVAIALVLLSPSGIIAPTQPSQLAPNGQVPPGTGDEPAGDLRPSRPIKDSINLTTDPNRNFRIFYNLELAPWAAIAEPLLGFGPRQQVAEHPDRRLEARVEAAGMDWQWARRFTNDSNYASLIVQFGVIAPAMFLGLLALLILTVAREGLRHGNPSARFAVAFGSATLAVAFFGPAFEIRTVSVMLWISLFGVLASMRTAASEGASATATVGSTRSAAGPEAEIVRTASAGY